MYSSSINLLQMLGPDGPTGNVGSIGSTGPTGNPGATGNTGAAGVYVTSSTTNATQILFTLSNGQQLGVTGSFKGNAGYGNTEIPESVGDGIEILGSSTEGQLNIKGISGTGSLVVSATDNNVSINTIYTSTVGNVYSVGLSADTLMYLKENDLASSTRVKMDGTGDLNFQNKFYLNDSALIKYVGPVKKNQYVGITGAIDNFTEGTTGGIYIDLENGGFYVLNTPIGIAGFTGSFRQNEIISASLLLTSDNIWKFPENVYFEQGENYLTCGKSLLNIFSFDSGQSWYAVVAQRGLDLSYTEKFITTTKTITSVIDTEVIDSFGKQFETTTQKFFTLQKINSQNQFVSSGGKTITNVKKIAEFDTCVPALSTGSCCYVKYPENTINCIDYVTKDQCDSFGGQYNPLMSCENSCGFTFGLCCSNGNCIENVSVDECNFFGGNYYAGITCGTYPNVSNGPNYAEPIEFGRLCFNPCENEKVACCKDGVCIGDNYSRIQCELILGGKAFTGGDCSTVNCCEKNIGRGACCACAAKDLLCFDDLTPAECASAEYDGIFMGEEERCENVNCKCVGGKDEAPEQTAPTFDLVLLNPTIRPNEQANIQILNVQDAEGGDLFYKVVVKQISPTPEIEFSSTNFEIITNQQITQYTTNSLIQIGTSETQYEIIVSVKDEQNNTTTKSEIVTISTNATPVFDIIFEPGEGSEWTGIPNENYPTAGSIGTNLVTKIIIPPNQQNLSVTAYKQLYKEISAGVWETNSVLLEEIQNLQIASQLNQVSIPLGNNISGLTAGVYALFVFVAEEPYTDENISTKAKAVKITNNAPPTVLLSTSSSNITLPTNSITLTATTSSDTTALEINETSGFGGLTITPVENGPISWKRTVSGLKTNTDGTTRTYTFTATATDDLSQSITSNSVSVAINNQAPPVEVFVPSTAISGLVFANPYTFGITGFASDPDGGSLSNPQFTSTSVSSGYAGTVLFTTPSLVSTSSSGSTFASQCTIGPTIVPGNYQFAFTAKDDEGSTVTSSSKTLTILNSPPVVTVTSPSRVVDIENTSFNTSIFGVSVSDPNEPISSIRWSVVGVPAGASAASFYTPFISSTGFANTDINFVGTVGGTYTIEFWSRDAAGQLGVKNDLTVKRNAAPTVSITTPATNPSITLPTNTVSFVTSASDVDGSVASYSWSSSPSTNVSFSSTSVSNPTATFTAAGTYTISVIVTDNNGRQSASASRTVTVNAANLPPTISSFTGNTPVIISNETASSVLTVTASDPESNPLNYTFSFVSANPPLGGQAEPTITQGSGTSSNTATVTGLRVPFSSSATPSSRTYTFRASVSDETNTPVDATTNIVVNSSAPVISFTNSSVSVQLTGTSQLINLGSLFGATANDPDGGTLSYQWQLIGSPSGAATPTLTNSTSISNFQATGFNTIGTYTFRLVATDDEGTSTNSSNATLILTSSVVPNLTVPANQVYPNNQTANSPLSLSVSNASSTATTSTCGPVTITASSTPAGPTITPPAGQLVNSSNNTLTISNIGNITPGTVYTIGVTATASTLTPPTTSYKTFTLRRNALPITPAITGNTTALTGQKITFGINGGAATDPDGTISNYSWKVSPTTGVVTPTSTTGASLTSIGITFNSVGTFGITYSATDNNSGTSTSSVFSVTISNPPTDPCALQNYSYVAAGNSSLGPAGQRFLYNLIVPNIKVHGTHIEANCTAVANKFTATSPNYDNGIAPFNDTLAGYKYDAVTSGLASGALKSFCRRLEPPASNINSTADDYVARPYSNFPYLRSNLFLSGNFSNAYIEILPYSESFPPVSGNRLKLGACYKVSRPYDLSLSFDSRTLGSDPLNSDLVQNFLTAGTNEEYIINYNAQGGGVNGIREAGKYINNSDWLRNIVRTDEGIPFIYRCSCWDNSTDKLVYTNWANYTNNTGGDKYNLSCPSGSTRKPISLIVVRYRIEDGLFAPASNLTPPDGPGGVSTTCHSALPSSTNDTLLTTDITAYYASYNNATAKTNGSQQECKLATGPYRLVKYTVNTTTNPPSNDVENRKTCINIIPGTCQACSSLQSYKYLPYGSNFQDTSQYYWEQVPETCPSSSNACAGQLQDPSRSTIERTYAQTKQNLSGTLGLTQFNSWAPPEWICLADCEDPNFHVGNISTNLCIFDMVQGCAPPTSFTDETPAVTDANGNENLIWIKIYNSEDSTQYECVPVLYDKDVLAQYELCEE